MLTGLLITQVVGAPVAAAQTFLTDWLRGMQGASAVMLGMLLGGMMAFDMGGPVNKAAYAFSTSLIASHVYTPMAATMAAGMTPPLAIALATRLFANRYTAEEREAGGATGILGLAFITEGAIPFVARDPLRMIPSLMAGSAVTGAISMAIGAELKVPHGGIFVLPIPGAVTHLLGYVAALIAGTLVSALAIGLLAAGGGATEIRAAQPQSPRACGLPGNTFPREARSNGKAPMNGAFHIKTGAKPSRSAARPAFSPSAGDAGRWSRCGPGRSTPGRWARRRLRPRVPGSGGRRPAACRTR